MKTYQNPLSLREDHGLTIYNSPGEFVADMEKTAHQRDRNWPSNDSFYSSETFDTVKSKAITGDPALAERAEKAMRAIIAKAPPTTTRKRVSRPYGKVNVGSYLANDPFPCRGQSKIKTETAPLAMVVSLNSTWSVTAEEMERRGVAIAALVKRVTKLRPVSLYISKFSKSDDSKPDALLIKFPTTPIDSYRLAYLLTSQGFARGMGFCYSNSTSVRNGGPEAFGSSAICFAGPEDYQDRSVCNYSRDLEKLLNKEVYYIPGADARSKTHSQLLADPVKWLNETCTTLTTVS